MYIAVLTPIPIERAAILTFLKETKEESRGGQSYTLGTFQAAAGEHIIVLRETGSRNSDVALATERIITHYQPQLIILTGIAGGVKDATLGDVVVGTKAYGYEAGKSTDNGFMSRPNVLPYSPKLLELARGVARDKQWIKRIQKPSSEPDVFFGPIASGDQVVASTRSEVYKRIKQYYNDTVALEMESIGFATAISAYTTVQAINIRSISDLIDGKDAMHDKNFQPIAAAHAAAFVFELIYQLNPEQFIMDAKTIAKQVVGLIFPLLKLDSVKEIGAEFKDATDGSIREIWEKVKPVFIEEFEAEDTPEEAKVAIRSTLRKEVSKNDELKEQLEALLKRAEAQSAGEGSVNITSSKNVVQGSNISVGGDFRLGDDKNIHIKDVGIVNEGGDIKIKGENIAARDINIRD